MPSFGMFSPVFHPHWNGFECSFTTFGFFTFWLLAWFIGFYALFFLQTKNASPTTTTLCHWFNSLSCLLLFFYSNNSPTRRGFLFYLCWEYILIRIQFRWCEQQSMCVCLRCMMCGVCGAVVVFGCCFPKYSYIVYFSLKWNMFWVICNSKCYFGSKMDFTRCRLHSLTKYSHKRNFLNDLGMLISLASSEHIYFLLALSLSLHSLFPPRPLWNGTLVSHDI